MFLAPIFIINPIQKNNKIHNHNNYSQNRNRLQKITMSRYRGKVHEQAE